MSTNNIFEKATLSMSGGSIESSTISIKDFTDICDALEFIYGTDQAAVSVGMFREVKELVLNGKYSNEKLNDLKLKYGTEKEDSRLTKLQRMRLQKEYPGIYQSMCAGDISKLVDDAIEKIRSRFPEAPHVPLVFYDARGNSRFFATFVNKWSTDGTEIGDAYAWSFNGSDMYLLHFVNGIFRAGILLSTSMVEALISTFTYGVKSEITHTHTQYGATNFVCNLEGPSLFIYMSGYKVLELPVPIVTKIQFAVLRGWVTDHDKISVLARDLIRIPMSKEEYDE